MKLNIGIVGTGNIGSIHYRIYKHIKEIGKIYLADINPKATKRFKEESFSDYTRLLGKVNLVSIAAPTSTHYNIASFFLRNKVPVLVEKPITASIKEASRLISLSKKNNTLLFVGHVERYNNAYIAIKRIIRGPKFIECHRLNPYPYRSLDISVVLDLMIHDIDIILDLVKTDVKKIAAKGVKVLSNTEDIANARLTFENGCIANITSSRISAKKERKIRIFMRNCYISMDYAQQKVEIYKKVRKAILKKTLPINKEQPLKKEIHEFINLVKKGNVSALYAEKAKNALALSLRIQRTIGKDNAGLE
ncbi:MAG: hypothetical protein B1H08_00830 [Candidatus Omnitrophica bacterium 4484_171]|nr:MAG: hypothetical protein B1H08_00830 [Candidatus Omnitrophica bacterium 4484_171]